MYQTFAVGIKRSRSARTAAKDAHSCAMQAARPSGCRLWYQVLDAFLRRLPLRSAHRSLTRCPAATAACAGRGAVQDRTAAASQSPIELECRLPSTFSTAPEGQSPYDTRHGFCYGHLPANYGGETSAAFLRVVRQHLVLPTEAGLPQLAPTHGLVPDAIGVFQCCNRNSLNGCRCEAVPADQRQRA